MPDNCRNFGTSHYFGRSHENVRFDTDNTFPMCNIPCHQVAGQKGSPNYDVFVLGRLGQKRYDALILKAHIYKKRDDKEDKIFIKELLKEVE